MFQKEMLGLFLVEKFLGSEVYQIVRHAFVHNPEANLDAFVQNLEANLDRRTHRNLIPKPL